MKVIFLKLPLEGKWSALADRKGDLNRVNLKLFVIARRSRGVAESKTKSI